MNDQEQERIVNWPMPTCQVGDSIVWLSKWNVPGEPASAHVTRVSCRSIECRIDAGRNSTYMIEVRHKDDPQLPTNPWLQQNGAWDYSPQEYRLRRSESMLKKLASGLQVEWELTPNEIAAEELRKADELRKQVQAARDNARQAIAGTGPAPGTENDEEWTDADVAKAGKNQLAKA